MCFVSCRHCSDFPCCQTETAASLYMQIYRASLNRVNFTPTEHFQNVSIVIVIQTDQTSSFIAVHCISIYCVTNRQSLALDGDSCQSVSCVMHRLQRLLMTSDRSRNVEHYSDSIICSVNVISRQQRRQLGCSRWRSSSSSRILRRRTTMTQTPLL